jgi:hypothetical protein
MLRTGVFVLAAPLLALFVVCTSADGFHSNAEALPAFQRGPSQTPGTIEIRETTDGQPLSAVEVDVLGTDTSASKPLLFSQGGETPMEDVQPLANITGVAVTFTPMGGSPGAAFALPARGTPVLVTMEVTIVRPDTVTGEILIRGASTRLATLTVKKTVPSAISVLGADPSSGLTLRSEIPDFQHTVQISSFVPSATTVRVSASPFTDPRGIQVQPTIQLESVRATAPVTFDIPPFGSIPVTFQLNMPLAGDYTGSLLIGFSDQVGQIPFKITRVKVAPTVSFDPAGQVRMSVRPLAGGATVDIPFALRETAGQTTSIEQITVAGVVEHDDGSDFATNLKIQEFRQNGQAVAMPLVLDAGSTEMLSLHLGELPGPGEYHANIRLTSGDGPPIETTITILVRYQLWVAMVIILVTVAVSTVLRHYFTNARPRLLDQQAILELREQLKTFTSEAGKLDQSEARVLDRLQEHLDALYAAATRGERQEISSGLQLLRLKLERVLSDWFDEHRDAIRLVAGAELLTRLESVEDYLSRSRVAAGKSADNETDDQVKALETIRKELNNLRITARLARFREALNKQLDLVGLTGGDASSYEVIAKQLDSADSKVASDAEGAEVDYQRARADWAKALAHELELRTPNDAPLGILEADWNSVRAQVLERVQAARTAATPELALQSYDAGADMLLTSLIKGLRTAIAERTQVAGGRDDLKGEVDRMKVLDAKLAHAIARIGLDDRPSAQAEYQDVTSEYSKIIGDKQLGEKRAASVISVALGSPGDVDTAPAKRLGVTIVLPSRDDIRRKLIVFEVLTSLVTFLIAALLGAQLLYYPDKTWGNSLDVTLAVLWGLGFQQVGGKAFEGSSWIKQQFGLPADGS